MLNKTLDNKNSNKRILVFFVPMIVLMFLFKILPFIKVIVTSFEENYNLLANEYERIGVENYNKVLYDPFFIQSIKNTLIYYIVIVPISLVFSVVLAWCLRRIKTCAAFFQTAIFLPLVTSDIAIGIAWRVMFNDKGIVNSILNQFSLHSLGWLSDAKYSLLTLSLFGIWNMIPMTTLVIYCAFLRLDDQLLISAEIDGAREFRILKKIGLPYIKSTLIMMFAINSIAAWMVFDGLFPLFNGSPGPYYNLYTIVFYIYSLSQKSKYSFGMACSASVILLLCVSVFMVLRGVYDKKKKI